MTFGWLVAGAFAGSTIAGQLGAPLAAQIGASFALGGMALLGALAHAAGRAAREDDARYEERLEQLRLERDHRELAEAIVHATPAGPPKTFYELPDDLVVRLRDAVGRDATVVEAIEVLLARDVLNQLPTARKKGLL